MSYLISGLLSFACLLTLLAPPVVAQTAPASASPVTASEGEPFDRDALVALAERLARAKYEPPREQPLGKLGEIGYDEYRDIRFREGAAIWQRENRRFTIDLFHPGFIYKSPVEIDLVTTGVARRVRFTTDIFEYGPAVTAPANYTELDYSGFRVRYPLNKAAVRDEFLVFQGASYFRAVGRNQNYGLSARGLAVKTADEKGEEFPYFTRFWIERPPTNARRLVIHALLDSPSVAGAFTFVVAPGDDTTMDVHATLFPRVALESFGVAPLTSMFLFDPSNRVRFDDFRDAVHDSDGLQMTTGHGEQIWRQLANPNTLQVSSFVDENPRGFGLTQRKRKYTDYEDSEARYELRPSLWVEPLEQWGAGFVELVEIPSRREANDNIVAFWRPAKPLTAGQHYDYKYRLHWVGEPPESAPVARVAVTRTGLTIHESRPLFVVDFDYSGAIPRELRSSITASEGKIVGVDGHAVAPTRRYRVSFQLDPEGADLVELRLVLTAADKQWSETWLYRWTH